MGAGRFTQGIHLNKQNNVRTLAADLNIPFLQVIFAADILNMDFSLLQSGLQSVW